MSHTVNTLVAQSVDMSELTSKLTDLTKQAENDAQAFSLEREDFKPLHQAIKQLHDAIKEHCAMLQNFQLTPAGL